MGHEIGSRESPKSFEILENREEIHASYTNNRNQNQ